MSKVLRLPKVVEQTGLTRSTIYDDIAKGRFPRPIKLGARSVGWLESELAEWLTERIAERDRRNAA